MTTVISLDDSKSISEMIQTILTTAGLNVICLRDWTELLPAIRAHNPDLLLLDLNMPMSGETVGNIIKKYYPNLKFLFVSGESEERIVEAAAKYGASGFVRKTRTFRTDLISEVSRVLMRKP